MRFTLISQKRGTFEISKAYIEISRPRMTLKQKKTFKVYHQESTGKIFLMSEVASGERERPPDYFVKYIFESGRDLPEARDLTRCT